ncbi:MaoC/PaaZ C-terminal domain-containing protein [Lacisediminimonas profundi]|uniref:MaoC/PaaZ C-terminal domain-containing protein n=1 Tax=Lacisediminimonas profundi TaxID=2603856 RepID=UPI00124AFD77|nr:MaoC/PaaZ C-terminal domain-containing protein [Lacisediminimonas profundi]
MKPTDKAAPAMTRRMMVQYSGIVQDFNPVHYDDEFAKKLGLPGAIAQGPLTVLLAIDALVAQHGSERLASVQTRLKAPVFPGDELQVKCDEQGNLSMRCGEREVLAGTVNLQDGME